MKILLSSLTFASLLATGFFIITPSTTAQESIAGDLQVYAPGVVHVGGYWIHLLGVQGPGTHGATQYRQEGHAEDLCEQDGIPYQCGLIAQGALALLAAGKYYQCELQKFVGDPRRWGICRPYDVLAQELVESEISLNRAWVRLGWARADPTYTDEFVDEEAQARTERRGIWAGAPVELQAADEVLSGIPTVVDSNTLRLGETNLRLFGIDGPELFQTCTQRIENRNVSYSCGERARAALMRLILGKKVYCTLRQTADPRPYAQCWVANPVGDGPADGQASLNEKMILMGWAFANRTVAPEYMHLQLEADRNNVGMHYGKRVPPASWRRGQR